MPPKNWTADTLASFETPGMPNSSNAKLRLYRSMGQLAGAYRSFDLDGDGTIDRKEFRMGMRTMNQVRCELPILVSVVSSVVSSSPDVNERACLEMIHRPFESNM